MLLKIPQVLTKQQVQDVRQIIDNADWADGVITAGSQAAKAKNNTQLPEDGDDIADTEDTEEKRVGDSTAKVVNSEQITTRCRIS